MITPYSDITEINAALNQGGTVTFAPGIYENACYKLSRPVHIIGYGASLIGGKRLEWEIHDGILSASVDETLPVRVLVVNNSLRTRCRLPETGYMHHVTEFKVPWMSTTGGGWKRKPTHEELTTLIAESHSLDKLSLGCAETTVVHSWDESLVTVASVEGDRVTFTDESGHPAGAFNVQNWCLWNVPEAFHVKGTFYHDVSARKLYYIPLDGEDVNTIAYIPTSDSIFSADEMLSNIEIEGFTLSVTDTPRISAGFGAYKMTGAINFNGITDSRLHHLKISAVGGYGIRTTGECKKLIIQHCEICDCGAGGLKVGSVCKSGDKSEVSDCYVHNIGIYYPSAIGIAVSDTNVSHCEVCHTSYSAINCGGSDYTIEKNILHDAMEVLNDGAAVYSFGSKRGVLSGNLAYGIHPKDGHHLRSAYYLDETAQDWLVCGNVSVDCDFPNHNHMCGGHLYKENIFQNSSGGLLITMHNPSLPNRYVGNRLSASGSIFIEAPEDGIGEFSGNIFHSNNGLIQHKLFEYYTKVGEKLFCSGGEKTPLDFTPEQRIFSAYGLTIDLSDVGVRK